jgi:hypothetical protein
MVKPQACPAASSRLQGLLQEQQGELLSPPQPQLGGPPLAHPAMTAVAHPTPGCTESAPAGQFILQAPHSMQKSASRMTAFFASRENILWGQTTAHIPHPVQAEASSFRVETFRMYRRSFI